MNNIPWYLDALRQGVEVAENMNIHPDLKQAAIDQGIRPAGYDAPITPITADLTMSYDFNAKEYVKGWNDGRNCAFDIILNLLERIEDKNGYCQSDKIKLVIGGFRMMEKEDTDI